MQPSNFEKIAQSLARRQREISHLPTQDKELMFRQLFQDHHIQAHKPVAEALAELVAQTHKPALTRFLQKEIIATANSTRSLKPVEEGKIRFALGRLVQRVVGELRRLGVPEIQAESAGVGFVESYARNTAEIKDYLDLETARLEASNAISAAGPNQRKGLFLKFMQLSAEAALRHIIPRSDPRYQKMLSTMDTYLKKYESIKNADSKTSESRTKQSATVLEEMFRALDKFGIDSHQSQEIRSRFWEVLLELDAIK